MRFGNALRNLKPRRRAGASKLEKAIAGSGISGKKIAQVLVWTLVFLMVAAGVLYIQASRAPSHYRPAKLSQEETREAVQDFARHIAQGFGNKVKMVEEFEWSITESTVNRYLASIDEIAFSLPNGVKRGHIDAEMAKIGLAGPAVALEDGKVTLMVRSTEYRKVLSADVSVELVDGKLRFALGATRVGRLPVPSGFLTGKIRALSRKMTGKKSEGIGGTLAELLAAIDGEPISPPDTWRIQGVKVDIKAITIADGTMTLTVSPIPPARK